MKDLNLEQLILANGRLLVEKTERQNIYKVIKAAKNVNYIGLPKAIEVNDLVICQEYMYSNKFVLNGKDYFIIKPSAVAGYFHLNY